MTDDNSANPSSSARQRQFDEILADLMRAIDAGESVFKYGSPSRDKIGRFPLKSTDTMTGEC